MLITRTGALALTLLASCATAPSGTAVPELSSVAATPPVPAPMVSAEAFAPWLTARDILASDTTSAPRAGAAGLGDRYYPELGNGGIDVLNYDLDLEIDPVIGRLDGVATLTVRALHGLSSFQLELWKLTVESVAIDGTPADVQRVGDELLITPKAPIAGGSAFHVAIAYGGTPAGVPSPSVPFEGGIGWIHTGDSTYVMSQPNGAPSFFPCNDTPLDKALYTFRITAPRGMKAVANGKLMSVEDHSDSRTTTWRASDPMVSYLATVAVGPFEEVVQEGPRGLPIRHYFHPSIEAADRKAFERAPEMIAFLEERFGPYPFESFGSIVSNSPIPAALETQTIPTYGAAATGESVIMHELAHQWFGNSVNVRDWSQLWISEGFASYASWLWTEHTRGPNAIAAQSQAMYGFMKQREVASPADPGIENLFGLEVYVRGPWVLHALRGEVGDEAFFETLRTFHGRHDDGHATIEDFVDTAVEINGPSVEALLRTWLFEDEVPDVAEMDVP